MKKVSVIVPVYNAEKYLERCILSILNQTLNDCEIILINDGSKDSSQEIIDQYKKQYPDKIKTKSITNSGAAEARNVGLKMAKGEFIGFVDSDDYIDKTMYEKLYNKAITDHADIVVCGYFTEDEERIRSFQTGYLEQYGKSVSENPNTFVYGVPYLWNKIYKREIIEENNIIFDRSLRIFEDLDFVYSAYPHANKISKVSEALYYYIKMNEESLTANFSEKFFDIFPAIQKLKVYYKKIGRYDELEDYVIYTALNHAYIRCNMKISIEQCGIKFQYINKFFEFMKEEFPQWKKHELYFVSNKKSRRRYTSKLYWKLRTIAQITKVSEFIKLTEKLLQKMKKYNPIGATYIKYYYRCPINEKVILVDSQHGNDINGNMFYLIKEINNNSKYDNFTVYLGVEKNRIEEFKKKLDFYHINKVKLLLNKTPKYMKILATAKFLITDTSFMANYIKKEGQVYLNTWHGTPLKTLGRSTKSDFYNIPNLQKNFAVADYLLYPNEYMTKHMLEDYMIDNIASGKILLCGYPRNSIFFNKERRVEIKENIGLLDKELIAYMPTWRGLLDRKDVEEYIEQLKEYLHCIDKSLKEDQILCLNLHPYVKDYIEVEEYKHIMYFPKQYETYDFLNICDILITDYSSVFFDYALTKKKIILFTYDEAQYLAERGLYLDINKLPFPKVDNIDSLINEINNKDTVEYKEFLDEFCKYDASDIPGQICEKIILGKTSTLIEEKIPNNHKKNVLILNKNFSNKMINEKFFELVKNTTEFKYNYYMGYINRFIVQYSYNLLKLPREIKYMGQLFSMCNISLYEKVRLAIHNRLGIKINFNKQKYTKIFKDELKRIYGNINFDYVIIIGEEKEQRIRLFSKFDKATTILYDIGQKHIRDYKNDFDYLISEDEFNHLENLNQLVERRK